MVNMRDNTFRDWFLGILMGILTIGGAAWANPTKQIAIDSLLYRHNGWASKVMNDICDFMDATKTMAILFPDRQIQADRSINALRFTAEKGIR